MVRKAIGDGEEEDAVNIIDDDEDTNREVDTEEFIDFTLATACHIDQNNSWCEAKMSVGKRKITSI